jgi:head-tail adaptor
VRAGRLPHEITLEQLVTSGTDAYGTPITSWVAEPKSVWSSIDPPSLKSMRGGGEKVLAGADTGTDIVEVTLFPYPGLDMDASPMKWRFRRPSGRVYDIKVIRESNGGEMVTLLAIVGPSDGL